jgi:hypothetical protein
VLVIGPFALVAQLDRASVYGTESRRFESCRARWSKAEARSESEPSSTRSGKLARSASFHGGPRSLRSSEAPKAASESSRARNIDSLTLVSCRIDAAGD